MRECSICFSDEGADEEWVENVCGCGGTLQWKHKECLKRYVLWRVGKGVTWREALECGVCRKRFKYKVRPLEWGDTLRHWARCLFVSFKAVALIFIATLIRSWGDSLPPSTYLIHELECLVTSDTPLECPIPTTLTYLVYWVLAYIAHTVIICFSLYYLYRYVSTNRKHPSINPDRMIFG